MTLEPTLVIAGKNSIGVKGALALRVAADERGWRGPIQVLPNATDVGVDGWQPSLRRFAHGTKGFELTDIETVYSAPDLRFFSLEYDTIVKTERTTSRALFNIHFSLLPAYKGMYTSALPILHGEHYSGVTLHRILRGIDTGPIIAQKKFMIAPDDTARDLYFKYLQHGSQLFASNVRALLDGDFRERPQVAFGSTYYGKKSIDYAGPLLDPFKTAWEVRNQIRAFTFAEYQVVVVDELRVNKATITESYSHARPGTVVQRANGTRLLATVDHDILLVGDEIIP